jgi:hypothetical protein
MELLVVTSTHTLQSRDTDGLARLRLIADTIRNAPGLVNARFYHSGEATGYAGLGPASSFQGKTHRTYQQRGTGEMFPGVSSSRRSAPSSLPNQFPLEPGEGWRGENGAYYFMLTTWEDEESWQQAQERYNPKRLLQESAQEFLSAPPEQWLMSYLWGYSRPAAAPTLAAVYLATVRAEHAERTQHDWIEGLRRQVIQPGMAFAFLARSRDGETEGTAYQQHTIFLNLLSWPNAAARAEFYADQRYTALNGYLSSIGSVRILALDPL